eukprot:CAMPEP_0177678958 /NCGR_PEP_ID=MMETSP0447-20121125/29315_1 /TAXON_ID=0 /ORGANISM="Stygamoeba regulata, Strain BSH-02190019" /LENGTH=581 /DNA_ID=CAMNT_0019188053 /DNA_START=71 /DNA_END=1817 /DNA_ORIENTATION=-
MHELLAGLTLFTGVVARQGCRRTMEDEHAVLQHVDPATDPAALAACSPSSSDPANSTVSSSSSASENENTGSPRSPLFRKQSDSAPRIPNEASQAPKKGKNKKRKEKAKKLNGLTNNNHQQADAKHTNPPPPTQSKSAAKQPSGRYSRQASYFAVYDGHGGGETSAFLRDRLHAALIESKHFPAEMEKALKETFKRVDGEFQAIAETTHNYSGSTAVVTVIHNGVLYCANSGAQERFSPATMGSEQAGGWIGAYGVNNRLGVSRGFGDLDFKGHKDRIFPDHKFSSDLVIVDPEITKVKLRDKDSWIVLACDGVWDVLTSEDVIRELKRMDQGSKPNPSKWTDKRYEQHAHKAAERIARMAFREQTTDNVTVVVIYLRWPTATTLSSAPVPRKRGISFSKPLSASSPAFTSSSPLTKAAAFTTSSDTGADRCSLPGDSISNKDGIENSLDCPEHSGDLSEEDDTARIAMSLSSSGTTAPIQISSSAARRRGPAPGPSFSPDSLDSPDESFVSAFASVNPFLSLSPDLSDTAGGVAHSFGGRYNHHHSATSPSSPPIPATSLASPKQSARRRRGRKQKKVGH